MRVGGRVLVMVIAASAALSTSVASPAQAQSSADCAAAGTEAVAADAQVRCDPTQGWRLSAWVGESGDGIVLVERASAGAWNTVVLGPFCATAGVAAATPAALQQLGMPADLAHAWGYPPSACDAGGLPRTGGDTSTLVLAGLAAVALGGAFERAARRRRQPAEKRA